MKEKHTELSLLVEQVILGESEQLDELKASTLGSYMGKSAKSERKLAEPENEVFRQYYKKTSDMSPEDKEVEREKLIKTTSEKKYRDAKKKIDNRRKGFQQAIKKLDTGDFQESLIDQLSDAIEYLDEDQIQLVAEMVVELMEMEQIDEARQAKLKPIEEHPGYSLKKAEGEIGSSHNDVYHGDTRIGHISRQRGVPGDPFNTADGWEIRVHPGHHKEQKWVRNREIKHRIEGHMEPNEGTHVERGLSNKMEALNQLVNVHQRKLKKSQNESVEQIDELKASTLGSYIGKGDKDLDRLSRKKWDMIIKSHGMSPEEIEKTRPQYDETKRKEGNRKKGVKTALAKFAKGDYDERNSYDPSRYDESLIDQLSDAIEYLDEDQIQLVAEMVVELLEMEQIDELKKETLGSYIKKASDDSVNAAHDLGKVRERSDEVDRFTNRLHTGFKERDEIKKMLKATPSDEREKLEKAAKRVAGIKTAVDKLTKGQYQEEYIEEALSELITDIVTK